jgi:tRNA pseudouridine-54 N-methylase
MRRLFVISLTELNFEKKDLNVPFSKQRIPIGHLARIITNAIFLSHSLREKVTIRVFIEKPISHLIQIDSATIRYLGPELRSLASLILKAKKKFQEALANNYFVNNKWLEANPGFFVRLVDNPFQDLKIEANPPHPLVCFISDKNPKSQDLESVKLTDLEELILNLSEYKNTFIIYLPLSSEQISNTPIDSKNFTMRKIVITEKIDFARLTNIVNIILDKIS